MAEVDPREAADRVLQVLDGVAALVPDLPGVTDDIALGVARTLLGGLRQALAHRTPEEVLAYLRAAAATPAATLDVDSIAAAVAAELARR